MKRVLVATMMLLLVAAITMPALVQIVKADDQVTDATTIEDPFTYTYSPAPYVATVSPGGSASVSVTLGLSGTGPTLTPPVTTTGWDPQVTNLPSGWTVTPASHPANYYTWGTLLSTVSDTLTVQVPSSATPGQTYTFTAYLQPGQDSDTSHPNPHTVGAGPGVAFSITVPTPPSDSTPPEITHVISGTLGNNGWYTSDVTVSWTASDPDSTITSTSGQNPVTINYDTAGVTLTYSATSAGGTSTDSVTIKRDATPPTIMGSASPAPNANGWNNQDVTVTFVASDAMSGIASVTPATIVSTEGAGQSVTGTAIDNAGNTAQYTVSGINIDKTAPTLTLKVPTGVILNQPDVKVTWTASDALSGVAGDTSGSVSVDTTKVGTQTGTVTVLDKAGNSVTEQWTVNVGYNIAGFSQPINMDRSSVFKLGSTVPTKFQLTDYYGNYISTCTANLYTVKQLNNPTGTAAEAVSTSAATTGSLFRYDATSNQYVFNLGTKSLTTGTYLIKATLDSGQTIEVMISLK